MRLLLVEDNTELAASLVKILRSRDYVVDQAPSVKYAKSAVSGSSYEIIILDRMLPDGDGLELIKYCKDHQIKSRFIILSALNELGNRIQGLDTGADDYITKPFEPEELLVRLRVALRHPLLTQQNKMTHGALTYAPDSRDFDIHGKPLVLPRRELIVLELLMKRFNRVVSREALEESMYGYDDEISSNSLESHISKLRKGLTKHQTGLTIHTVRGIGYLLKEEHAD